MRATGAGSGAEPPSQSDHSYATVSAPSKRLIIDWMPARWTTSREFAASRPSMCHYVVLEPSLNLT